MILNTCAHTNSNPIISVPKWRQLGTRQMKRNYNRNRPISTRKFVRLERNRETVPSDNELCKSWKRFANVFESLALQFPLRLRFTSRAPAYLPYARRFSASLDFARYSRHAPIDRKNGHGRSPLVHPPRRRRRRFGTRRCGWRRVESVGGKKRPVRQRFPLLCLIWPD